MEFLFGGRMGRLAYLLSSMAIGAVFSIIWWMVVRALVSPEQAANAKPDELPTVLGPLMMVYAIMLALYILALLVLTVKRLHDLDMSGWHYLWIITLPIMMTGLAFGMHSTDLGWMAAGTYLLIWGWLMFYPGTQGANQYGER